jgi:hypothetical protein
MGSFGSDWGSEFLVGFWVGIKSIWSTMFKGKNLVKEGFSPLQNLHRWLLVGKGYE